MILIVLWIGSPCNLLEAKRLFGSWIHVVGIPGLPKFFWFSRQQRTCILRF